MKVTKMLRCFSFCVSTQQERDEQSFRSISSTHDYPWEIYSLKELVHATNNFHDDHKLGEGGFGTVYWGRTTKGVQIAVKKIKAMTAKAEMEFAVEVEILGRVRHKNLLGLRGFYAGGDERLIVYDYMPNHSLMIHLHGPKSADANIMLDWPRRMDIALGSAEGIAYLHNEANPRIIHRDVKASNVLLDSEFKAKVADFGFARLIPDGLSHVTTRVKGTLGYLAPEYAMWGKASDRCDVYSFGILLLEIISARKPIEKLPGGVKRDIVQWLVPLLESGKLDLVVDPRLAGRYDKAELRNAVIVAMRCTEGNPDNRPTMKEVVQFLKDGLPEKRPRTVGQNTEIEQDEDI